MTTRACDGCGVATTNPRFCSRPCAARTTNREAPKRQPTTRTCATCGATFSRRRSKYCSDECNPLPDYERLTVGDIRRAARYQVHARLREHARGVMRASGTPRACRVCGYDKHVEVSHRRALHTFPDDTLVAIVNAITNLEYLCPNHHWEHEAGVLAPEAGVEPALSI